MTPHECPHCGGFLAEHDISIMTVEYSPEALAALRVEVAKAVRQYAEQFSSPDVQQFAKSLAAGVSAAPNP